VISFDTNINPANLLAGGIFLYTYLRNRRKDKEDIDKRHEENKEKLDEALTELHYYPPHSHTERRGALTYEGIQPKR
jgi:hypothetical protein